MVTKPRISTGSKKNKENKENIENNNKYNNTQEPGGGAAALQLQAWLEEVCGGWANSFG